MAIYLMGDLQGCADAYQQLLSKLSFSPSRDHLYILGDLVNRGPQSLEVLRHVMQMQDSIHCLLGNHDLHLVATANGVRKPSKSDTLAPILMAPDAPVLLEWLRHQPLARYLPLDASSPFKEALLVHAGVMPSWTVANTLMYAQEVSDALAGPDWVAFLAAMYGNKPKLWAPSLQGMERLRMITNVLTRLRFCTAKDKMDFEAKEGPGDAPAGYKPWFEFKNRKTQDALVAFGHWSTLGLHLTPNLLGLDTGCVWGGALSAIELQPNGTVGEVIQVKCPSSANPLGVN
jgi:bis(5'-nucleosyl)-tetraphosphatase (symmetrical)